MKIGQYEIRRVPSGLEFGPYPSVDWSENARSGTIARLEDAAVAGAFAVADDTSWWRALHQVINDMEWETIQSARSATLQPNECAAHTQSGEALDLLRKRLVRLRGEGIKGSQKSVVRGQKSEVGGSR